MDLPFEVVELPPTDHVAEGDRAPDFERPLVTGEDWTDTSLADLTEEGPVVVLFHPMDGAFPATYLWNEVRDREWAAYDLEIVGLSISDPYAHSRLVDERDVDHALFSDPANGVAEAYGIVNDLDGMAGIAEPRPAAFVIDEDRTVTYAWVASEWPDFPPYDEIEDAIETQLQGPTA